MTKEQIREWLASECNINENDGAIALTEVIDLIHRFQEKGKKK